MKNGKLDSDIQVTIWILVGIVLFVVLFFVFHLAMPGIPLK